MSASDAEKDAIVPDAPAFPPDTGLDREKALRLLGEQVSDRVIFLHMIETEAIMRSLAREVFAKETQERRALAMERWGVIGLLHDIDWEKTKDDVKNHTVLAENILRSAGGSDFLVESVVSHAYGNPLCGSYPDRKRTSVLHHCLAAAETVTGLVIASALMQPDRKLASVKAESLRKKFRQKSFAANCDREIIKEIEQAGFELDSFLDLALESLQDIHEELGL